MIVAALAALVLLTPAAPAGAIDVRTAAQEGAAPKFIAATVDGKPRIVGLCIDILRAIERVEPEIRFVGDQQWLPFIRVETAIDQGQLDVGCGMIRTREREKKNGFIDTPMFPVDYLLVVRADDDVQVRDWTDVRKLGDQGVVLTIHGFVGIATFMKNLGGLHVDPGGRSARVNLDKLLAGRGRFFVHRTPGIYGEIASSGLQDKVKVLPTVMYTENFHMMVARTMTADTRDKINRALIRLGESGEMAKLVRQWDDAREPRR